MFGASLPQLFVEELMFFVFVLFFIVVSYDYMAGVS